MKNLQSQSTEPTHYDCDKCQDIGFIIYTENGEEYTKKCECRIQEDFYRMLNKADIAGAFEDKKVNQFEAYNDELKSAKSKIVEYVKAGSGSLLISGLSGRGKSHLGIGALKELQNRGRNIQYAGYRELINEIKPLAMEEQLRESKIKKYKETEILMIDDLYKGFTRVGKEIRDITPADIKIIYEIVNYRYNNNMQMIITTELSPAELMSVDEAIGGRIIEMSSKNIVLIINSPNYRTKDLQVIT